MKLLQNAQRLVGVVHNYEIKAQAYHNSKMNKMSDDERARLEADYKHLNNEKSRIKSVVIAQTALEEYRTNAKDSSIKELQEEKHHPTNQLASHLFAVGEPKPTNLHEAHHIISGKGRFNKAAMVSARLSLHLAGVGINDPHNRIWLINFVKNKKIDWATTDAPRTVKFIVITMKLGLGQDSAV